MKPLRKFSFIRKNASFIGLITLASLLLYILQSREPKKELLTRSTSVDGFKLILMHSKKMMYFNRDFSPSGQSALKKCPINSCYLSANLSEFPSSDWDAVVLDIVEDDFLKKLRGERSEGTYYVYFNLERPVENYRENIEKNGLTGAFNLTATYRQDSDFFIPYFRTTHKTDIDRSALTKNYAEKSGSRMAAWFVSHCNAASSRDLLVSNLQKYINVDIFGKCGTHKCPKNEPSYCNGLLKRRYKFYLAFENALCIDYVTEKLRRAYWANVVPVVYGLSYQNLGLPPHSFIDVLDFTSVKSLANYLKYLDKNDTAYNEYFRWRSHYETEPRNRYEFLCDLCKFLNENPDHGDGNHRSEGNPLLRKRAVRLPQKKKLNVRLPRGSLAKRSVIVNGRNKRYINISEWFFEDTCITPENDNILSRFLHH